MALDVTDLRSFYGSPLGETARRFVGAILTRRWDSVAGLSIAGLGYATPYLEMFRDHPLRLIAMMPAEQGVVNWPASGPSSSTLIDDSMLPLPDSCIDRMLLAHALENAEHPRELLSEVWRVLTPGGRLIVVAPNRSGLWARLDTTPFGHGRPYSRGQLMDLMREIAVFADLLERRALYPAGSARGLAEIRAGGRAGQREIVSAGRRRHRGRGDQTALSAGRRQAFAARPTGTRSSPGAGAYAASIRARPAARRRAVQRREGRLEPIALRSNREGL